MKSTQLAPETERVLSTEEQQVIEKLCTDYKENLTKRFKEILDHDGNQHPRNPKVLGANALIAEHLHSHGYFISQSVFGSEIELPQAQTNKNSESETAATTYRLKESDVAEIINALGLSLNPQELSDIIQRYYNGTNTSLLTTLLLHGTCTRPSLNDTSQKELLTFNKYLKILLTRIAKVSMILGELKRKRVEFHRRYGTSPRRKSGRKSGRNRDESQIHDLAKKIEKLTVRLAAIQNPSATHVNGITFATTSGGRVSPAKSYRQWIKELKESRHGQRMMRKIERIIVNSLNKEQTAMQKNFDEKLDTQKMILKLYYKQKFLEHFQALNLSNEPPLSAAAPYIKHRPGKHVNGERKTRARHRVDTTTTPLRKKQKQSSRDYKKKSSDSYSPSSLSTNNNKESKDNCGAYKLIAKGETTRNRVEARSDSKKNVANGEEERAQRRRRRAEIVEDGEIGTVVLQQEKREENDKKIVRLKNVEQLIKDAKDRIKLLQRENERLDQSFNTYLERQSLHRTDGGQPNPKDADDIAAIWESYNNVDKLILEKKRPGIFPLAIVKTSEDVEEVLSSKLVVPEIRVEKCKTNLQVGQERRAQQVSGAPLPTTSSSSFDRMIANARDTSPTTSSPGVLAVSMTDWNGGDGNGNSGAAVSCKDNSSGEFSNPFMNFDVKQFLESTAKQVTEVEGSTVKETSKSTE